MFQSSPAVHEHENRDRPEPEIPAHKCPDNEAGDSEKSQNCGDHQAASSSQDKPEKGSKNLTPIQGIDGQDVEDQQAYVDGNDCAD
jgi:hypothetical protein